MASTHSCSWGTKPQYLDKLYELMPRHMAGGIEVRPTEVTLTTSLTPDLFVRSLRSFGLGIRVGLVDISCHIPEVLSQKS